MGVGKEDLDRICLLSEMRVSVYSPRRLLKEGQ